MWSPDGMTSKADDQNYDASCVRALTDEDDSRSHASVLVAFLF